MTTHKQEVAGQTPAKTTEVVAYHPNGNSVVFDVRPGQPLPPGWSLTPPPTVVDPVAEAKAKAIEAAKPLIPIDPAEPPAPLVQTQIEAAHSAPPAAEEDDDSLDLGDDDDDSLGEGHLGEGSGDPGTAHRPSRRRKR